MENKQPLLSICIPTYNRCDVLSESIKSIVNSPVFKEIELVISDNCSEDNTENLVLSYVKQFPNNIKYIKTDKNGSGEENFVNVLAHGNGKFLKLSNDYSVYKTGSIEFLLEKIKKNMTDKPILFFLNNGSIQDNDACIKCSSIDSFVQLVSWDMAWIGRHGLWKEDFDALDDKLRFASKFFIQIDWIFRLLVSGKKCLLFKRTITERYPFSATQGGYNFFQIHIQNYLDMQQPYVEKGLISQKTYLNDKRKLFSSMFGWILRLLIRKEKQYCYDTTDSWKIIWYNYKNCPYFYISFLKLLTIEILKSLRLYNVANWGIRKAKQIIRIIHKR
jgi:glycosyltransferase involved in cell wall biosynthesis